MIPPLLLLLSSAWANPTPAEVVHVVRARPMSMAVPARDMTEAVGARSMSITVPARRHLL